MSGTIGKILSWVQRSLPPASAPSTKETTSSPPVDKAILGYQDLPSKPASGLLKSRLTPTESPAPQVTPKVSPPKNLPSNLVNNSTGTVTQLDSGLVEVQASGIRLEDLLSSRPEPANWREKLDLKAKLSDGSNLWQKEGPPSSGHIHTHPIGVHRNIETNQKILVKDGPEHTTRADYAAARFMELAGIAAPKAALIKSEGKPLLGIEYLEGFEGGMKLPERFHDDERIQSGLLVQTMVFNYDCVPWNFMWEKNEGQGLSFIDFGASLGSRAQGGYNGFPDRVDLKQLEHVLTNPQYGGPANPAFDKLIPLEQVQAGKIRVGKPELMSSMVKTLTKISDDEIDKITQEAWGDIKPEASLKDLNDRLQRLGTKNDYKSSLARQTIRRMIDDFGGDQQAYYAHALKGRRESLLEMFSDFAPKR